MVPLVVEDALPSAIVKVASPGAEPKGTTAQHERSGLGVAAANAIEVPAANPQLQSTGFCFSMHGIGLRCDTDPTECYCAPDLPVGDWNPQP
jgi:hypothetical protein